MNYPLLSDGGRYESEVSVFGGYNHNITCAFGEYYNMRNMSSLNAPVMETRQRRGLGKTLENPQGLLDKETVIIVDDCKLYADGEEIDLGDITLTDTEKSMAKMGAYVIIMPDRVWYNTKTKESGRMDSYWKYKGHVEMHVSNQYGSTIEWHDSAYYETNDPKDGDYLLSTASGKASLKVYSTTLSAWQNVTSTYFQINAPGIGSNFDKEDGVYVAIKNKNWEYAPNIFVNEEEDGYISSNFSIIDKTDDSITVTGLLDDTQIFGSLDIKVERRVPEMAYITECNNRLWGCSTDGHEIYACKLGDVKNWNCFMGVSTDSWAVTIGSDGIFTGAVTYLGYPIFFKEESLIKIAVSATGGHQTKETICRGVQNGSAKSISITNEMLLYKSTTDVCLYTGSMPASISEALGKVRYSDAVSGSIDNRYYISMKDSGGKYHMFVYDRNTSQWIREDNTHARYFCKHGDDLYYVDADDNRIKSVYGSHLYEDADNDTESAFDWSVESGNISYDIPESKFIGAINVRATLGNGSRMSFYVQYDDGEWIESFDMVGYGQKSFNVPVIPVRCDHFRYRISGHGECKIHSINKRWEKGSDQRV